MPLLDAIAGAIAACHCEKPLGEKIDQSVTPFSAALFSALITHKNWLVLSGVYAGIILGQHFSSIFSSHLVHKARKRLEAMEVMPNLGDDWCPW